MKTQSQIEEEKKQEDLNRLLANELIVKNPELAKLLQNRINYQIILFSKVTNDFEATRAYHRQSALQDLLNDLVTLNAKYIYNQSKPLEVNKKKITVK